MRNLRPRALVIETSTNRACVSCRLQRRPFSSSTAPPPKPPSSGLAPLLSRGLISVAGPDAAKFLQGIITGNVVAQNGLPRTDAFYCGFLNATGRILNDVFIYPNTGGFAGMEEQNNFLVEADAGQIDVLARYIKRYKLRAKLAVRKIQPDEIKVWQAWNDDAAANSQLNLNAGFVFKDPRAPSLGHRMLKAGNEAPEVEFEQTTEDAYTIRRYLNGVPEGQDEILKETALPQESNMDFMKGIDYRKGCYVGQELTIRTKHRGVVRKRILPCIIYPKSGATPINLHYDPDVATSSPEALTADMIPQDTSIGRFEKRGRSAGKWLKGVGNIGLGLCRLEIMTGVQLPGETAAAAWQADDEFVLEWGEEENGKSGVKVKAFVPEWVQAGLDSK